MSNNLVLRVSTGIPLAAVTISYIYLLPEQFFLIVSLVVLTICAWEYGNALYKKMSVFKISVYLTTILFYAAIYFFWKHYRYPAAISLALSVLVLFLSSIFAKGRQFAMFIWYLIPGFWFSLPVFLLSYLRFRDGDPNGSNIILFIIIVAAFNDIFAYLGGKKFGKHLLAPVISPKKTIEGSIFGLIGGILAGLAFLLYCLPNLLNSWIIFPVLIVIIVVSQIGDLAESKFKRYCGIKDSSGIIPGHGGLLDRIDAYLFAVPTYVAINWVLQLVI